MYEIYARWSLKKIMKEAEINFYMINAYRWAIFLRLECHEKSRLVTHIFNHRQKNVIERINNVKLITEIKSKNHVVNKTFKYKCTSNVWQMLSVRMF